MSTDTEEDTEEYSLCHSGRLVQARLRMQAPSPPRTNEMQPPVETTGEVHDPSPVYYFISRSRLICTDYMCLGQISRHRQFLEARQQRKRCRAAH